MKLGFYLKYDPPRKPIAATGSMIRHDVALFNHYLPSDKIILEIMSRVEINLLEAEKWCCETVEGDCSKCAFSCSFSFLSVIFLKNNTLHSQLYCIWTFSICICFVSINHIFFLAKIHSGLLKNHIWTSSEAKTQGFAFSTA